MKFDNLTIPNKPFIFKIWRLLVSMNFAKTFIWSEQNKNSTQRTNRYFSIHTITKKYEDYDQFIFSMILGPFILSFGLIPK